MIVAYFQQENRQPTQKVSQESTQSSEGEPSRRELLHVVKGKRKHIIDIENVQGTIDESRRPRTRSVATMKMKMVETIQQENKVVSDEQKEFKKSLEQLGVHQQVDYLAKKYQRDQMNWFKKLQVFEHVIDKAKHK